MTAQRPNFLYGDAAPFPLPYDALSTVKGLVAVAAAIGRLHEEVDHLDAEVANLSTTTDEVLSELASLAADVGTYIETRGQASRLPAVEAHATQIVEGLVNSVEGVQARYRQQLAAETSRVAGEIGNRRRGMWSLVVPFLLRHTLTVESVSFTAWAEGEAMGLGCEYRIPDGIRVAFELDPRDVEPWTRACKVSDFVRGIELKVGLKRKAFSRSLVAERIALDTFSVTRIELEDQSAEITLARSASNPGTDVIVLTLSAENGQVSGLIQKDPGTPAMETHAVEADDLVQLRELWDVIRGRRDQVLANRKNVRRARLDEREVESEGLVVDLVERLVRYYRPIVEEIDRRSPNPEELSLKIERGDGRREEIYLDKRALMTELGGIPASVRNRFLIPQLLPPGLGHPAAGHPPGRPINPPPRREVTRVATEDGNDLAVLDELEADDIGTLGVR